MYTSKVVLHDKCLDIYYFFQLCHTDRIYKKLNQCFDRRVVSPQHMSGTAGHNAGASFLNFSIFTCKAQILTLIADQAI